DAVAHQIAVALLDDIAKMDADAEFDASIGWQPGIPLDHAILHLDRAAHRLDHAAKLDEHAVARTFDNSTMMHCNGRIDQIAAERSQPRQRPILVGAGEPTEPNDIGGQNRRNLPGFGHARPLRAPLYHKAPAEGPSRCRVKLTQEIRSPSPAVRCG